MGCNRIGIFLVFFLGVYFSSYSQHKSCELIFKTDALFQKHHINPLVYDATVYHEILNVYINGIDAENLIFSKNDSVAVHAAISKSKTLCDVFFNSRPIIIKRLLAADSLVKSLNLTYLKSNNANETIVFSCLTENAARLKDDKAVYAYANKYYKYLFLQKSYLLHAGGFSENDQKIIDAITLRQTVYLKSLITDELVLTDLFLKALSQRFDPHSTFLNATENEELNTSLSKEELSFGFDIEVLENNLYKISGMIPGGAAWNSKQIEVGDIIDQIELKNGTKYLVGIDTDKMLFDAMLSKDNMTMTFYLTKTDGVKVKVVLAKTKVEVLDNIIDGYVIQKDHEKYGYIKLPSFYDKNSTYHGVGCSSDLAREILQLKKDTIDGLILDLRNNGGGYVDEALAIAGLFIDEGVLALTQFKGDKPRYLKDPNRGMVYNGKLIVLVNQYSASASELLAGILQCYRRAIIVGNTTYGKATMQVTLPIDSTAEVKHKNNYYANVTTGKFYMINKHTHQAFGIVPDIEIKSVLNYVPVESEAKQQYYLAADSVVKNVDVKIGAPIFISDLKQKSAYRLNEVQWDINLKKYADSINYYVCNNNAIALTQKSVYAWEDKKANYLRNDAQSTVVKFTPFPISNTSVYNALLKKHTMYSEYNQLKIDELKKDFRLFETINILSDYINQP